MRNVVSYTNTGIDYVTVAEIKQHLRLLDTDEDSFLEGLIEAAFDIASEYVGYSIRKASVEHWFETTTSNKLMLYGHILSVTSAQYVDENGVLTALAYNAYGSTYGKYQFNVEFTDDPDTLIGYGNRYKVVCVEGFELSTESVNEGFMFPSAIRSAIFMIVANLYENRIDDVFTSHSEIPMNSKYLLNPYKVQVFV